MKKRLYEWKYLGSSVTVSKRKRRDPFAITKFLMKKIKQHALSFDRCLNYALYDDFDPYLGRKGPVTFVGTPTDVINQLRRYQKGLD